MLTPAMSGVGVTKGSGASVSFHHRGPRLDPVGDAPTRTRAKGNARHNANARHTAVDAGNPAPVEGQSCSEDDIELLYLPFSMLFLSLQVVQDSVHSTSFSSASLQLFNVKEGARRFLISWADSCAQFFPPTVMPDRMPE